ncbi:hypothetical protein M440DRAFT_1404728 [Trichoderma longibrachiatum ATCC 18648]|uniref:Uncharacterized protein n=1 Tax=Trichoderma longibrachiatum ATCC 18648 TaxID=983965 RepID=A0A2T4BUM5_TRILO|nr:hypothetical protein M440DRAFT_1404728 [Trichoderma longibrachiatum ATCC 18648]
MPSSRKSYPSSMYPEVGSSYQSNGYSDNGANDEAYSTRRSYERNSDRSRYREDADVRRHRHDDDARTSRDLNRSHQDKNNQTRDNRDRRRNSTGRIWERVLPADFRPSQADPDERHRRRSKEKECEGFDWTPGVVLALLGAAALFNHERSLVRRRKKEYIER